MPIALVAFAVLLCFVPPALAQDGKELHLDAIKLPKGFSISVYAKNVPNARSMALSPSGILFVGSRVAGNVYALLDTDQDFKVDRRHLIATGLLMPNGVAFKDGALYVAEVNRVWRFDDIEHNLNPPPKPVLVSDRFPTDKGHGWKYIHFGPDGKLYVPVGAPCNACQSDDPYAAIVRMDPDGQNQEVFARGIRNTVGFDWDPRTQELWFTDNGRDNLGDNFPPDELNHAPKPGMHFGYPFCHGNGVADVEVAPTADCSRYTPAAMALGPHVASLGMEFYRGKMFPKQYRGQIFIAEHGSWNRTDPLGYRITLVRLKNNQAVSYEVFAQGWLTDGEPQPSPWGRPVDLEMLPDGSMLVSDDHSGTIYRIAYQK